MGIQLESVTKKIRRPRTELDDIPADVKQAVDEAFKYCKENPGDALRAEFTTQEEAADFLHDAKSYAFHCDPQLVVTGTAGKNGVVRFDVADKTEA